MAEIPEPTASARRGGILVLLEGGAGELRSGPEIRGWELARGSPGVHCQAAQWSAPPGLGAVGVAAAVQLGM